MSQENHFPATFQSDRSWNIIDEDDGKYRYYASFNSEKSWTFLGSQDADAFGSVSTYGYGTTQTTDIENNSRIHDYVQEQQQLPISSFPEPEFKPSLSEQNENVFSQLSTAEFLEDTFKFERKRNEDF
ncbi:11926_t:CDS:2 [Diversispora eburnea]|uniref:11926_t:CDS:1 n=1 Tax=Diversispora eburnea TaxID=1213867 RepID=A0A9N8V258_9GLOM|nr:11926_t:CDS:2 [Diversispora eburnea]